MRDAELRMLTAQGMFVAKRTDHFYSGNRKGSDENADSERRHHTRGITDSILTKFTCAMPKYISICAALEESTGVNSFTPDQHRDLRPEYVHIKLFTDFFTVHPQFPSDHNNLIDISTGVVAAPNVNCDDTFEVGRAAATKLVGVPFTYTKVKRGDQVINICGLRSLCYCSMPA